MSQGGRGKTSSESSLIMKIYTIGYEGFKFEEFARVLVEEKIEEVVDIRYTPISRKPGFSKRQLAGNLEPYGISYVHLKGLGCPKEIRETLKETGDFEAYREAYVETVAQAHPRELMELAERGAKRKVCLLCFEADYRNCHRSIVAEELRKLSPAIVLEHLPPAPKDQDRAEGSHGVYRFM